MDRGQVCHRFAEALEPADRSHRVPQPRQRDRVRSAIGIERAHGSYEELTSDPDVDVVYIATPHNAHLPHALLALQSGKHTVVEKPLALNAIQGQRIADEARSRGLFCMEAYWTAFLPKFDVLRQLLGADTVGDVAAVVADFGEWFSASHRIHRPELAGGPMLDLGTYLISFVLDVVGPPDHIIASGTTTGTGVMGQTAMLLSRGDQQAVLHTTILANTRRRRLLLAQRQPSKSTDRSTNRVDLP